MKKQEILDYTVADDLFIKTQSDIIMERMVKVLDGCIYPREARYDIEESLLRILAYGREKI